MLEIHSSGLSSLIATGSGQATDGTLVVDISNFTGSSFDWHANHGVVSVFLRISGGGVSYDYAPPATSDNDLSAGGQITNLSFCYAPSTPTPTPTLPDTAPDSIRADASSSGGMLSVLALLVIAGAALVIAPAGLIGRRGKRRQGTAAPWSTARPT